MLYGTRKHLNNTLKRAFGDNEKFALLVWTREAVMAGAEALTDILLRIHTMRQRWPRDSDKPEIRLTMLAVEDVAESLQGASRKIARLRRCMIR